MATDQVVMCLDCGNVSEGTWPEYSTEALGTFHPMCLGCLVGAAYWLGFGEGAGSFVNLLPRPVVPEPDTPVGWPPIPPGGWPL